MKYTIQEIAEKAGVSKATVSRVMNGTAKVSEETKAKVEATIKKFNYEPNLNARKLAGGNGGSIALVLDESVDNFFSNPFWRLVVDGFISYVSEHHLHPVVFFHSKLEGDQTLIKALINGHYDAIAIFGWHHDIDIFERKIPKQIRVVFGGRQGESSRFTYVGVDNVLGGEIATKHLIERGCRNIVHISGDLSVESGRERLQGYRNAHKKAGIKVKESNIIQGDYSENSAKIALERFLKRRRDFDGVFAANDLSAIGAVSVIQGAGYQIPAKVKVIGFDGTDLAKNYSVPLSTVAQPSHKLGSEVARQLTLPKSEVLVNVNLDLELIARESTQN